MIKKVSVSMARTYMSFSEREIKNLQLEQDYELASLFRALRENNELEISKCKTRLKEIHLEIEKFKSLLT